MSDFKKLLAEARRPEKTVPICLRGDLVAEFEDLDRQLDEAERRQANSLAGNGTGALATRIEQLREEMLEHTVTFRFRALPRPQWRQLVEAHPPRSTDDGEIEPRDRMGVNADTFFDAMIRACVVDPEGLDDSDWAELFDEKLSDMQYDQLSDACWSINRRGIDVPFSSAASRISRDSSSE